MIGVEQRLRRRVADHVDFGLAVLQQIADLLIGPAAVAFAGEFPLNPGGLCIRAGEPPTRKRILARPFGRATRGDVGPLQRDSRSRAHFHGAGPPGEWIVRLARRYQLASPPLTSKILTRDII